MPRNTKPVGPSAILASLVHQALTDIEYHRSDHVAEPTQHTAPTRMHHPAIGRPSLALARSTGPRTVSCSSLTTGNKYRIGDRDSADFPAAECRGLELHVPCLAGLVGLDGQGFVGAKADSRQ